MVCICVNVYARSTRSRAMSRRWATAAARCSSPEPAEGGQRKLLIKGHSVDKGNSLQREIPYTRKSHVKEYPFYTGESLVWAIPYVGTNGVQTKGDERDCRLQIGGLNSHVQVHRMMWQP